MGHEGRRPDVRQHHIIVFPASRRAIRRQGVRLVIGLCLVAVLVPGVFLVADAHNMVQQMVLAFCWLTLVYLIGRVLWLWVQWNEYIPRKTARLHASHQVRALRIGVHLPDPKLHGPSSDASADESRDPRPPPPH